MSARLDTRVPPAPSSAGSDDDEAQGTSVLVSQEPHIDATLVEVMPARELPDLLSLGVGPEANAALQITAPQLLPAHVGAGSKREPLRVLLEDVSRDAPLKVRGHQVVEEQDAEYPVHHNADKVQEAVPPEMQGEGCLLLCVHSPQDECHAEEPAIVKEKQPALHARWVLVDVEQALRYQLRCGLIAGPHEEPPRSTPEVGPRHCADNARQAAAPQHHVLVSFGCPELQDQRHTVDHQQAAADHAQLNPPLHDNG
mmetsp:Transcript_16889/g.39678  ORF Transcript_16889/g.39678 Transcript_16889/m.39678 type:complete len:255 (+) Transcript_16889:39-803(+)